MLIIIMDAIINIVFLTDTMCMSLPDIILVFLFLYMYTICSDRWISLM